MKLTYVVIVRTILLAGENVFRAFVNDVSERNYLGNDFPRTVFGLFVQFYGPLNLHLYETSRTSRLRQG